MERAKPVVFCRKTGEFVRNLARIGVTRSAVRSCGKNSKNLLRPPFPMPEVTAT
jgi:hypothetical protein